MDLWVLLRHLHEEMIKKIIKRRVVETVQCVCCVQYVCEIFRWQDMSNRALRGGTLAELLHKLNVLNSTP